MPDLVSSDELTGRSFDPSLATTFKRNYYLRTLSAGCYFFEPSQQAWIANGLKVKPNPKRFFFGCRPFGCATILMLIFAVQ
jgi:hypothetical protein